MLLAIESPFGLNGDSRLSGSAIEGLRLRVNMQVVTVTLLPSPLQFHFSLRHLRPTVQCSLGPLTLLDMGTINHVRPSYFPPTRLPACARGAGLTATSSTCLRR